MEGWYQVGVRVLGLIWNCWPSGTIFLPVQLLERVGSPGPPRGCSTLWPDVSKLPVFLQMHTPDIGGQGTTSQAIQDIIRHIRIINGRAVEA